MASSAAISKHTCHANSTYIAEVGPTYIASVVINVQNSFTQLPTVCECSVAAGTVYTCVCSSYIDLCQPAN